MDPDDYTDEDLDDGENLPADVYVERLQKGHYTSYYPTPDEEAERERQLRIDFNNLMKEM